MTIIETRNFNDYVNKATTYQGTFQTAQDKKSKFAAYLDSLYSYPPKIKIKWNGLDEFTDGLLVEENSGILEPSFPFLDVVENWLFNTNPQEKSNEVYSIKQYINGYLDKVHTTNFYNKNTKPIQKTLQEVPVFVVLNGNGEIILNKPSNGLAQKNLNSLLNENVYDFCGGFDSKVEKRQQLGLFFLSRSDAEVYLKAVAQADIDGTQTVGLSINCIGLDAAYKVTREHHPGIDFRFVPDLVEVQNFLSTYVNKQDVIIEEEQQQLRLRPRTVNLLPSLEKVGLRISQSVGAHSFLQRSEYFKGVPIYIVQVQDTPRNLMLEQYFNTIGAIDTAWGKITNSLDHIVGNGQNGILQGSLQDVGNSEKFVNYVFFEKTQASTFVKQQGRKIVRYPGARVADAGLIVRKPKIFVYNLEDFIETWEDQIISTSTNNEYISTIYQAQDTYFVSPTKNTEEVLNFQKTYKEKPFKGIIQALGLKVRVLKRNISIFVSVD